jgi:hypothetical protein
MLFIIVINLGHETLDADFIVGNAKLLASGANGDFAIVMVSRVSRF